MEEILVIIFFTVCVVLSEDIICSEENICQGREGDTAIIPCGPVLQQNETTHFTYYNESSKSVLLHKSSIYLTINLSIFYDKTVIGCAKESESGSNIYSYLLSVIYPPRVIGEVKNSPATRNQPFSLQCPLVSNPQQFCSWTVYNCFSPNTTYNASDLGISFPAKFDGCLLHFNKVTYVLRPVCYVCIATNDLGSDSFHFNNIDFPVCLTRTIIMSPIQNDKESNQLRIQKGQNFTLKCDGFGFSILRPVHWCFNNTKGSKSCQVDKTFEYDFESCHKTSILTKEKVDEHDSGIYYCFFDSEDYEKLEVVIIEEAYKELRTNVSIRTIVGVGFGGLAIILIVSIASVFATRIIKRRCSHLDSENLNFMRLMSADLDDTEYIFDAFISFAEEDKETAEVTIKTPLEFLGYNICWHHDDFVPGCTVNENIESCILRSKFVIALISRSFFLSNFCQSELEISRQRVLRTGQNCLLPVMVEQWDDIPTELLKITYIDLDDTLMLERLQTVLGLPIDSNII